MTQNSRWHRRGVPLLAASVAFGAAVGCGGGRGPGSAHPWADWPMPNPPGHGLPNPQQYTVVTVAADEVVRDEVTQLVWERRPDLSRFPWADAVSHCKALQLGGWSDWRLPSRIELVSLLDLVYTRPTIDPNAFPDTAAEWFWTASPGPANHQDQAWDVYFYFGYPDIDVKSQAFSARCVRSGAGQSNLARYAVDPEVVRDLATRLTWERQTPPGPLSFADAGQFCADLVLGGQDDWRLPSLQEFETIVDETRSNPAVDPTVFPDTPAAGFWSGTPWAGTSLLAWHVDFDRGGAAYDTATMSYRVRCVR